jgi:hypothetical protein
MSTHGTYKEPVKSDDYSPSFAEAHGINYGFIGIRLSKSGVPFRVWRFADGKVSLTNHNRQLRKEFINIVEAVRWLDCY